VKQPKDFGFGEDEQLLRDSVRKFLSENAGIETVRRSVAGDHRAAYEAAQPPAYYDEKLWRQIIDLGWAALAVPESAGGLGMKMIAVAAVAEEAGRAALVSPLISTLLATLVVREASGSAVASTVERIVAGTATTLAITNSEGSWESADTDVTARRRGQALTLNGTAYFVQDARKAEQFVVSAKGSGGIGLYLVRADAPGVEVLADRIVDLTRDQGRLQLSNVRIEATQVLAPAGEGAAALQRATPALLTVVAADMCGAAEWQLQTTAAYAQIRKQFDHPLGFFQAVKHPIVNMMLAIDAARSLVYNAAAAIDAEPENAEGFARMAKAAAADAAAFCSGRSVQLHGGIGFTWECDVHIYFKRQKHNQMLLGDATYQRTKLAALLDASS